MITGDHRALREALGYYILGRLPSDEAVQVRAHLDGCAECRAELTDLQPLAQRLASVQPDRLDVTPTPPAGLGEAVLSRIDWERRQQTRTRRPRAGRIALLVAAAVTAIAVGTGIGWMAKPAPVQPATIAVALEKRPDVGVDGTAELVDHTWGLEVVLHASGLAAGGAYRVEVIERDGDRVSAGGFVGTGRNPMVCRLNSAVPMGEAVSFEVIDESGRRVLWSTWG